MAGFQDVCLLSGRYTMGLLLFVPASGFFALSGDPGSFASGLETRFAPVFSAQSFLHRCTFYPRMIGTVKRQSAGLRITCASRAVPSYSACVALFHALRICCLPVMAIDQAVQGSMHERRIDKWSLFACGLGRLFAVPNSLLHCEPSFN